jgi:hypothetical protein
VRRSSVGLLVVYPLFAGTGLSCRRTPTYGNSELAPVGRAAEEMAQACGAASYRVMMAPRCGVQSMNLDGRYPRRYALDVCGERTMISMECWAESNSSGLDPDCVVHGRPRQETSPGFRDAAILYALERDPDFPCFCDTGAVIAIEVTRSEPAVASVRGCGPERRYRVDCKPLAKGHFRCATEVHGPEQSPGAPPR